MSRTVIQVGDDLVAYDGRYWTPVSGEGAEGLARVMKASEWLYSLRANTHPDHAHNIARAAAEEWRGQIVEYQPDPPRPKGPRTLY